MIIDLSICLQEGMITFPVHWHPVFEMTQLGRFEVEGRETRKITMGTHTGTHVDAPRHFIKGGRTIEQMNLDLYYGKARVIDFTDLPDKTEISLGLLKSRIGDNFPPRIIFRYDWDRHLNSLKYYSDHPYLSEEACEWMVSRGIVLVGTDAPMPDDPRNGRGSEKDSPNHTILLGAGVVILEYLTNLKSIPTSDFTLSALPIKLAGADGAPVRAIAIV